MLRVRTRFDDPDAAPEIHEADCVFWENGKMVFVNPVMNISVPCSREEYEDVSKKLLQDGFVDLSGCVARCEEEFTDYEMSENDEILD